MGHLFQLPETPPSIVVQTVTEEKRSIRNIFTDVNYPTSFTMYIKLQATLIFFFLLNSQPRSEDIFSLIFRASGREKEGDGRERDIDWLPHTGSPTGGRWDGTSNPGTCP